MPAQSGAPSAWTLSDVDGAKHTGEFVERDGLAVDRQVLDASGESRRDRGRCLHHRLCSAMGHSCVNSFILCLSLTQHGQGDEDPRTTLCI